MPKTKMPKIISDMVVEMSTQDNAMTTFPMFVVYDDRKEYVGYDGDWSHKERVMSDMLNENDLCAKCLKRLKADKDLPDECDECAYGAFYHYKIISSADLRAGVFFTKKACEDHIEKRRFYYYNPRPYCIGAWSNPEMQNVIKFIFESAGVDIPQHYL